MKPKVRLPITSKLFLMGELNPRFAGLVSVTWKQIPLRVRRQLLAHWRQIGMPPLILLSATPLSNFCLGSTPGIDALAHTQLRGHVMRFYTPCVERMPDSVVCALIAHELAHVLQWAQDRSFPTDPIQLIELEKDADRIGAGWGFDMKRIDVWGHQYIESMEGGVVWREKPLTRRSAQRHLRSLEILTQQILTD